MASSIVVVQPNEKEKAGIDCNRFRPLKTEMSYQTSYHYYQKVKTRYERMRAIAMFLAFAFCLSLIGLAFKDWRIAAGCYATALCYLPFFARGR